MLGKLLKHEFKVTSRYFIPMYLAIAVTTVLLKLSLLFSEDSIFMSIETNTFIDIIQGLLIMVYVLVIGGTLFLSMFLLIRRFYVNVFGDEGYLMHTLPVTGGQILNSKLICAFLWLLSLIPIGLLSFFVLFAGTDIFSDAVYYGPVLMDELAVLNTSGFSIGLIITEAVLAFLLSILCSLLTYYLCIALGQHFMGNHRLLGAVIAYFVLSIFSSMISSIYSATLELTFENAYRIAVPVDIYRMFIVILGMAIIITLIQAIVYYLITRYLLTKKLNLY